MATERINPASQITSSASNQAARLQTRPSAQMPTEEPTSDRGAVQNSKYEIDRVSISSEAANGVTRQAPPRTAESMDQENREFQKTQPPEQGSASALMSKASPTPQTAEAGTGTERNGDDASNISGRSPAETRSDRADEQAERQVIKAQTVQNYTNASMNTQINGRKIDENV